jgi:hypothetical protein
MPSFVLHSNHRLSRHFSQEGASCYINHILGAFELCEKGQISPEARAKIVYCRKLIGQAKDKELIKQANNYARAIGSEQITTPQRARQYLDGIAADCARYGCD